MDNAHDSGENASADLWEIKSALWLVRPASNTSRSLLEGWQPEEQLKWLLLSSQYIYLLYVGKLEIEKGQQGCVVLQGERQRDFDPQIETDGGS